MVASDGVRAMMESALTARDRVGVQDFVLLENYTSEAAFIENLRKRFKENLIYVSESIIKASSVDGSGPSPLGGGGGVQCLMGILCGISSIALFLAGFGTSVSSLHPDVHRLCAGVSKPLQGPGDLHQGPHGAIPWS